jgi:hypothetical protein
MYSKVKVLRKRGTRRGDHEIGADSGIDGDLTLALCRGGCELKLAADDGSRQDPVIPVLYEAELVTMHGNMMLFRGIERIPETGAEFRQEWSVKAMLAP